jgi:hypothetical protein
MREKKFTPEWEKILLDPNASDANRSNALWNMRCDHLVKHEALVVSLIDHPNSVSSHLRAEAVVTLLHWGRLEYVPLALERLESDPWDEGRWPMASQLAYLANEYPAYRETVLRALVASIENDPDDGVAATAYCAAVFLLVPESARCVRAPRLGFKRKTDIDWTLLEPYRGRKTRSTSLH